MNWLKTMALVMGLNSLGVRANDTVPDDRDKAKVSAQTPENQSNEGAVLDLSSFKIDTERNDANKARIFEMKVDNRLIKLEETERGKSLLHTYAKAMQALGLKGNVDDNDVSAVMLLGLQDCRIGTLRAAFDSYEMQAEDMLKIKTDKLSSEMMKRSKRFCTNSMSRCYTAVKNTANQVFGNWLSGKHAYEAIDFLQNSPNHVDVKIKYADTDKVPSGSIVVFDKGTTPSGHIYVAIDGTGPVKEYKTPYGEKMEYEAARERSDHVQNANLTGIRGNTNQKYGQAHMFVTAESQLDLETVIKIGADYAQKVLHIEDVTPRDVVNSLDIICKMSSERLDYVFNHTAFTWSKSSDGYWKPKANSGGIFNGLVAKVKSQLGVGKD